MAQDHKFRVTHERTGAVATECESYIEASEVQYHANRIEQNEGRPPFWRMWLVDEDGIAVRINNQLGF